MDALEGCVGALNVIDAERNPIVPPEVELRRIALQEYEKAAACFKAYVRLLGETLSAIPERAQLTKATHTHQ